MRVERVAIKGDQRVTKCRDTWQSVRGLVTHNITSRKNDSRAGRHFSGGRTLEFLSRRYRSTVPRKPLFGQRLYVETI